MKKLFIFLLIISFVFAGDWRYEDMKFSSGLSQVFDTIESFYTLTYEVGRGKELPSTLTITNIVVPDTSTKSTGDSVRCIIFLDLTNGKNSVGATYWYEYGAIDTITLTNTQVQTEGTFVDTKINYPILDYRYFRLKIQSMTVDTFTVQLQKSMEF